MLNGVASKEEFCVKLIYGIGYSFEISEQSAFAAQVGFFVVGRKDA